MTVLATQAAEPFHATPMSEDNTRMSVSKALKIEMKRFFGKGIKKSKEPEYKTEEDTQTVPIAPPPATSVRFTPRTVSLSHHPNDQRGILQDPQVRFTLASGKKMTSDRPLLHLLLIKQGLEQVYVEDRIQPHSREEERLQYAFQKEAELCILTVDAQVKSRQF
jgi:hypothetical protein